MKININEIKEQCLIWLNSMNIKHTLKYKMCKSSYDEYLLDSISLAYDLRNMLCNYMTDRERDLAKSLLDEYQCHENGFFYEKDYKERLKNKNILRVEEMHGNYITFQVIGAYESINRLPKYKISFYDNFIKNKGIKSYLENNCPWQKSPWGAGGMVDNLGTILRCNIKMGYEYYESVVYQIFEWLNENQSSKTGLWGSTEIQGVNGIINGGYHLMRGTFFTYNKEFNYYDKIIDSIIYDLKNNEYFNKYNAHGCQDLDHFYLLEKCFNKNKNYRTEEIMELSIKRLKEIINLVYCQEGGFSFEAKNAVKIHNYYQISPGLKESDMQGTVFYLQTIKSILKILGKEVKINDSKTHG